jgi:AcrR family transcriptional regulator
MQDTQPNLDDPKVSAILYAAFDAFRMYGFRRTSMEDIARGAGMSRAALYLHFKNKDDIFRSRVSAYYAQAVEAARAALEQTGSPEEILLGAFTAQSGEGYRQMLESPHGEELMDTKHATAGAAAEEGEAALVAVYTDWLAREAAAGRITLAPFGEDAGATARTMLTALYGLKAGNPAYADYCMGRDRLAVMFGRSLRS